MVDTIGPVDNSMLIYPGGVNGKRLSVFGGESFGFANDVLNESTKAFYKNGAIPDGYTVAKGLTSPVPYSVFNKYALFNFRGMYGGLIGSKPFSQYLDTPNNPLFGGDSAHNVSISKIVQFFDEVYPKISYRPQDFIYNKYYKKIPVNHLITLRRFPMPVNDNIFDLTAKQDEVKNEKGDVTREAIASADATQVAGVTAVTYLGETAGNKLEDILSFTYGLAWKEIRADMEALQSTDAGYTQQPFYNKLGSIGGAVADTLKGVTPGTKFRNSQLNDGTDRLGTTYANFVLGPVNVVNETTVRNRGIKFSNDIKLKFDYELKSLNYVNPKIAMIDIISNMLTMTTNNGQFFGGGQRYYGSGGYVGSQFGDINLLKNGNFSGYIGSVVQNIERGFSNVFGDISGGFNLDSLIRGGGAVAKTLLGNVLGSFLSGNVGAVGGTQATAAIISGEPTGNWHITVGNPLNPIVMMGNMYCDNAAMTLGGGLGYDDFPMEVSFEIDLKHGKPRDKGDIENMFNAGRGRIYASAANTEDILNLKGLDVATYGSVQAGKANIQQLQSAPRVENDINNNLISNIKTKKDTGNTNSIFTDNDSTYVASVVSMIIDS